MPCSCIRAALLGLMALLPLLAAAAGGDSAIPFKQAAQTDDLAARVIGALVLVSLIGIAIAVLIRRFLPGLGTRLGRPGDTLQIKQRIRMTASSQLVIVTYRQEELLLAEGPQGVQLLRATPLPAVQAEAQ